MGNNRLEEDGPVFENEGAFEASAAVVLLGPRDAVPGRCWALHEVVPSESSAGKPEDESWPEIGRTPTCEILLNHYSVSRKHAGFKRTDEGWFVVDFDSRNGTFVNGQRVTGKARLRHGDRLSIGKVTFSFISDGDVVSECRTLRRRAQRVDDMTIDVRPRRKSG